VSTSVKPSGVLVVTVDDSAKADGGKLAVQTTRPAGEGAAAPLSARVAELSQIAADKALDAHGGS
jgi:hypothetical protein